MSTLKVGTIQNHSNSATVATEKCGFLKQGITLVSSEGN